MAFQNLKLKRARREKFSQSAAIPSNLPPSASNGNSKYNFIIFFYLPKKLFYSTIFFFPSQKKFFPLFEFVKKKLFFLCKRFVHKFIFENKNLVFFVCM